jgi:HSP20 family protein
MALPAKRYWDPFSEMRRLMNEMDDVFGSREVLSSGDWNPRLPIADIEDKGDSLELVAELPGMNKEDINVEVDRNSVTISAERKSEDEQEKKDYYYCERSYSGYKRSFALPSDIDPESVEAGYENGLLKLSMKKAGSDFGKRKIELR